MCNTREKIKEVFKTLDYLLAKGDYTTVSNILNKVSLITEDTEVEGKVLIAYLSVTNPWKNTEIKESRDNLLESTRNALYKEIGEERTNNILKGLK
jgi:hypothetical protein